MINELENLPKEWSEIQDIEEKFVDMASQVNIMAARLRELYTDLANEYNKKYSDDDFIKETDFTSDTLYYCVSPLQDYSALFYVEQDGKLYPIQFYLSPPENPINDPILTINVNPSYTKEYLSQISATEKDVIVKVDDIRGHINDEKLDYLINAFENPPQPTINHLDEFEDYIKERLYDITKNEKYKRTIILPN